jgi:mono/diheme cytochrome c family protein
MQLRNSSLIAASGLAALLGAAAAQTGPKKPGAKPGAGPQLALGRKAYDANGCAGCHMIAGKGGAAGPDLSAVGADPNKPAKYLADHVANPKQHNPASTMPAFAGKIKPADLTALGAYLASLKSSPGAGGAVVKGPKPDPKAIAKLEAAGGRVMEIAQTDDRLDISFHLGGNAITDAVIAPLAQLKRVLKLDLGFTGVTDAGLAHVRGLTGLTHLHLEGTKVTDRGMTVVATLKNLEYLNLYSTAITDAGLSPLSKLPKLKSLYLWQSKATQEGVKKLKEALPKTEVVMGWDQPAPAPVKTP